jgi:hypothetical protein
VATPAVIAGENAKISDVVPEQPVKHKSAVLSPQRSDVRFQGVSAQISSPRLVAALEVTHWSCAGLETGLKTSVDML